MTPILCIGETKDEYELGLNEEICTLQLSKDMKGLSPEAVSKLVIAYEPVWAIGKFSSAILLSLLNVIIYVYSPTCNRRHRFVGHS